MGADRFIETCSSHQHVAPSICGFVAKMQHSSVAADAMNDAEQSSNPLVYPSIAMIMDLPTGLDTISNLPLADSQLAHAQVKEFLDEMLRGPPPIEVHLELLERARPDDRKRALGRHPRDGDFARCHADLIRNRDQAIEDGGSLRRVFSLKPGSCPGFVAPVLGFAGAVLVAAFFLALL